MIVKFFNIFCELPKLVYTSSMDLCFFLDKSPFILEVSEWVKSLSRVQLFVTPLTIAHKAPLSMEFSRQEYWSGLPFPSPGDLPDSGIKPRSPVLQADTLLSEPPGKPKKKKIILEPVLKLETMTHSWKLHLIQT